LYSPAYCPDEYALHASGPDVQTGRSGGKLEDAGLAIEGHIAGYTKPFTLSFPYIQFPVFEKILPILFPDLSYYPARYSKRNNIRRYVVVMRNFLHPALRDIESGAKVEKRNKKPERILARRHRCRHFVKKGLDGFKVVCIDIKYARAKSQEPRAKSIMIPR
jgi:hypothetical protein